VMLQLGDYVALDTDYYLIVQHDGYALNRANCGMNFWSMITSGLRGRSGFIERRPLKSLVGTGLFVRSLKFVNACREASTQNPNFTRSEDALCCWIGRGYCANGAVGLRRSMWRCGLLKSIEFPEHPFWPA